MAGNTFGKLLTLTSFGESHGNCIGGVLDGFPAGIVIDTESISRQLEKRRSSNCATSTPRHEPDKVRFLSGIHQGKSTGAPIAFLIENHDVHHTDDVWGVLRPSHASYTYWQKYGFFDYDGSGRASARETVVRVVGGSLAQLLLQSEGVEIHAFTRQVGDIALSTPILEINTDDILKNSLFCPDKETNEAMEGRLQEVRAEGDTLGALVGCIVRNVPCGWGEPVYAKLQADLAQAMLGINAAKGFEYGSGFASIAMRGSECNDLIGEGFHTLTNHSGGIQGGISNGEDIYFSVAFKPIPTLMQNLESRNEKGEKVLLKAGSRHDTCVIPRVIPVVESMTALVLADHLLMNNAYKPYTYR